MRANQPATKAQSRCHPEEPQLLERPAAMSAGGHHARVTDVFVKGC
jgi:hypothetical protein